MQIPQLAYEIDGTQLREIKMMEWLLNDIEQNDKAETQEDADKRPVPEFEVEP